MEPDSLGFKYPNVDLSRCIDCSLCVKTCPFN
ncbi:MAG: 4Fe-4S binding protein, partial [Bacteroidales bacterium]|nr:4Fe-4S binding protein [Bacteroidales bacterium]